MMNVKLFIEPEIDIEKFMIEDVITTSIEPIDPDQGEII